MGRVVLFHGPHRPLELTSFPVPSPRGAEVLVRITCCTLCSSDLHTHAGRRSEVTPTVLGHEIVGRIEAFGPDAPRHDLQGATLQAGDRVTWTLTASCGHCFFCADGLPQKCEHLIKYGHRAATQAEPFVGGFADFIVLAPGTGILRVPEEVPDTLAAPANCATATVAAMLRYAGGEKIAGRVVLILGAGVLGLTASAMARASGAASVVVSDPDGSRRERADVFGATHLVSADADELSQVFAETTQGRGADVVLELAGVKASVETSLARVRIGGTVVLAGTVTPTAAVALDSETVVRRMLTIRGVHNYAPVDLQTAMAFLDNGGRAFPFATLVGRSFRLEEAEEAFAHAHSHPGVRVAVVP